MECKSCGAYYKGKVCPKCGYGGEAKASKAAAKYKKATKPERFRTAEDHKLYAQWEAEKKEGRVRDPDANKKFLAVLAIVVVIVVFLALWQSGAIFSNDKNEVIANYFNSIQNGDYDTYLKCFPKEMRLSIEQDRDQAGLSKKEYMLELYDGLAVDLELGSSFTVGFELGKETPLDKGEYDMSGYEQAYGKRPAFDEVLEQVVDVDFIGTDRTQEARLYLYMGKSWGYWHIYGMDEDVGSLTE